MRKGISLFSIPLKRIIFFITIFYSAPFVFSYESEWWNTDWSYRGKITVLSPRSKSDIDTASFLFYPGGGGRVNKDFSDIRIIDKEGGEVPYKIASGEDGSLIIDFRVDSPSKAEYYIYFGNPKAEKVEYMWEPITGSLFLEVREKSNNSHPKDLPQMEELIKTSIKSYGKGPRDKIDDLENPFGSNENYLSIYQGNIFCPLDGKYGFATNSDDGSFLLIDGKLVASWPEGHEKEGKTNRPLINEWVHSGEIHLERGAHLIQYYQEDSGGGQLSRAGWKKPGDKEYDIIPKEAFIDKLKARQASFQTYSKPLNAFFFAEEKQGTIFNRQIPELISFQFHDACISEDSQPLSYQWDFGDGSRSDETNPLHVYPAGKTYTVKLLVRDAKGLRDTYEQCIQVHPSSQLKNIQLDWRVTSSLNIFYSQEPLQIGSWIKNYSDTGVKLKLSWESIGQTEDVLKQGSREFTLGPNQAEKADIPSDRFVMEKTINFYLSYGDNVIDKRQIDFLDKGSEFKGLKVVENHVEDLEGRLMLLRIKKSIMQGKTPISYLSDKDRFNIVVLGASLCNKDEKENYQEMLKELLESYYGDKIKLNLNFIEIPEDVPAGSGLLGISRLEEVIEQEPDIVLFSLGMNEAIQHLSLEEFKRSLDFLLTALKCRGISNVLLIPPPVIDGVMSSMDVAVGIKEVGIIEGVEVIDLFSIFPMEENALSRLYQPDSQEDVYLLYPNKEGQRIIAEQVFEKIKKNVPESKD